MTHPLGGFARRASYIHAFAARYPSIPRIQVDTGVLLAPPDAGDSLINQAMLASLEAFPIDAINLSTEDLHYFWPEEGAPSVPAIKPPFVSANIQRRIPTAHTLKPYLIKSVPVKTPLGSKTLRIGITGIADPRKERSATAYSLMDPVAAAKRVLSDLRSRCDLLLVLTDLSQPQAAELARSVPGIDIIINGEKNPFPPPPDQIKDTFIFGASYQGRQLGELRVYLDKSGEVAKYRVRYIGLDRGIPDDSRLASLVTKTRTALSEFHRKQAAAPVTRPAQPVYAGTNRCMTCHAGAHAVWSRSAHAHAIETLKAKGQEYNPQCVGCHSTGFGVAGGFVNVRQTPDRANVQCEACHGPGLVHAQNPAQGLGKRARESCLPCHTSIDSPHFDFAKAWGVIKH